MEGLPDIVGPGMCTVHLFPSVGEVIVDPARVRDVVALSLGMGNVGCRRNVVVFRAPKGPPPIVPLPVPFIEASVFVFPLTDAFPHDVFVIFFASVDESVELTFVWDIDLVGNNLKDSFFAQKADGSFTVEDPRQDVLGLFHVDFLLVIASTVTLDLPTSGAGAGTRLHLPHTVCGVVDSTSFVPQVGKSVLEAIEFFLTVRHRVAVSVDWLRFLPFGELRGCATPPVPLDLLEGLGFSNSLYHQGGDLRHFVPSDVGSVDVPVPELGVEGFAEDAVDFDVNYASVTVDVFRIGRALHHPRRLLDDLVVVENGDVEIDL